MKKGTSSRKLFLGKKTIELLTHRSQFALQGGGETDTCTNGPTSTVPRLCAGTTTQTSVKCATVSCATANCDTANC